MKITEIELRKQYERADKRGWLAFFLRAAERFDLPAGLLVAIASRETNLENIRGDFRGGRYHGYGVMQVDIGTAPDWINAGHWRDPEQAILKGAEIFKDKARRAFNALPDASWEEKMRVATASYNAGQHAIEDFTAHHNPDKRTTGRDYSADVWDRFDLIEQWMTEQGVIGAQASEDDDTGDEAPPLASSPPAPPASIDPGLATTAAPAAVAAVVAAAEQKPAPGVDPPVPMQQADFLQASVGTGKRIKGMISAAGINIAAAFGGVAEFAKSSPVLAGVIFVTLMLAATGAVLFWIHGTRKDDAERRRIAADPDLNNVR